MVWVKKIGLYQLTKSKEKSDDWIIILDQSIQLGKEKLLVILGLRKSCISFNKPLQFEDLVPLCQVAKPSWNNKLINEEIKTIEKEI